MENYFIYDVLRNKFWANFQKIIEIFTQKIVTKLSKIWFWDPGSGGQKGTGSRIRNTDCMLFNRLVAFAVLHAIVLLTYWKGNAQHGSLYGQPVRLGQGESVHIIICKNKKSVKFILLSPLFQWMQQMRKCFYNSSGNVLTVITVVVFS